MFQREIGAGRCEATGAARANLAGRERTTAPGVQRAPSPVVTVSCGTWQPRRGPDACASGGL